MHNLKDIRNNFEDFKKKIKSRNVDFNLDEIIDLDQQNRDLIHKKETLEQQKKDISKSQDKSLFNKSKQISIEIQSLSKEQLEVKQKLDKILSSLPNIPLKDVPLGKDDTANKIINHFGQSDYVFLFFVLNLTQKKLWVWVLMPIESNQNTYPVSHHTG